MIGLNLIKNKSGSISTHVVATFGWNGSIIINSYDKLVFVVSVNSHLLIFFVLFQESHKKNEQSAKQTLNNCTNQDLKTKIIQDSLSRLHVTNCHTNSDNLALIFQNIETQILSNNLTLDVVIIENFLNFYFEDISVQICSIAKYISKILTQSVLKYVKKFNIAILYTRWERIWFV